MQTHRLQAGNDQALRACPGTRFRILTGAGFDKVAGKTAPLRRRGRGLDVVVYGDATAAGEYGKAQEVATMPQPDQTPAHLSAASGDPKCRYEVCPML